MELINNVANNRKLIDYLVKNIKTLMENSDYDTHSIIHSAMEHCELYFSNKPKSGELKRKVVVKIIQLSLGLAETEIIKFIEYACKNKNIKKYNKIISFIKRSSLKKKLKVSS